MKRIIILFAAAMLAMPLYAQQKKGITSSPLQAVNTQEKQDKEQALEKVYDEEADPMEQINMAIEEARISGRLVICQVGGNWCPWCLRFAKFINDDKEIAKLVKENFVYIHINTSKEHKNYEALKFLGNPGRFGYPALVVLNEDGRVIHIQNSAYLEKEKSYDRQKVLEFFQNWTRKAIETIK